MAITFSKPCDDDGFFSIYDGATVFDGDSYIVKLPDGKTERATAAIDEGAYFLDANSEVIDDVEWFRPAGVFDRVGLSISATEDGIPRLLKALEALSSVSNTGGDDD